MAETDEPDSGDAWGYLDDVCRELNVPPSEAAHRIRWLKLRSSTLDTAAQAIGCEPGRIAERVVEVVEGRKKVEEISEQRRKLLAAMKEELSGAENDFSDLPARLKARQERRKARNENDVSLAKEITRLAHTNQIYLKVIGRQLDELEGFLDDY